MSASFQETVSGNCRIAVQMFANYNVTDSWICFYNYETRTENTSYTVEFVTYTGGGSSAVTTNYYMAYKLVGGGTIKTSLGSKSSSRSFTFSPGGHGPVRHTIEIPISGEYIDGCSCQATKDWLVYTYRINDALTQDVLHRRVGFIRIKDGISFECDETELGIPLNKWSFLGGIGIHSFKK